MLKTMAGARSVVAAVPPIGGRAIHPPHRPVGRQTPLNRAGIVIARLANTGRRIEDPTRG
jgi:hypothetical protein